MVASKGAARRSGGMPEYTAPVAKFSDLLRCIDTTGAEAVVCKAAKPEKADDAAVVALLKALEASRGTRATSLSLAGHQLSSAAHSALKDFITSQESLKKLDLSGTHTSGHSAIEVTSALLPKSGSKSKVGVIDLSACRLGLHPLAVMSRMLDSVSCHLRTIVLRYNPITAQGLGLLLKWACCITEIDAAFCGILTHEGERDEGLDFIIEGLRENTSCSALLLQGNGFTAPDRARLVGAMHANVRSALTEETMVFEDNNTGNLTKTCSTLVRELTRLNYRELGVDQGVTTEGLLALPKGCSETPALDPAALRDIETIEVCMPRLSSGTGHSSTLLYYGTLVQSQPRRGRSAQPAYATPTRSSSAKTEPRENHPTNHQQPRWSTSMSHPKSPAAAAAKDDLNSPVLDTTAIKAAPCGEEVPRRRRQDKQTPAILNACLSGDAVCRKLLGDELFGGLPPGQGEEQDVPDDLRGHSGLPNILNTLPLGDEGRIAGIAKLLHVITFHPLTQQRDPLTGTTHPIRLLPGIPQSIDSEDELVDFVVQLAVQHRDPSFLSIIAQEGYEATRLVENQKARALLRVHRALAGSLAKASRHTSTPTSTRATRSRSASSALDDRSSVASRRRSLQSIPTRPAWDAGAGLEGKKPWGGRKPEPVNLKKHLAQYWGRADRLEHRRKRQGGHDQSDGAVKRQPGPTLSSWHVPISQAGVHYSREARQYRSDLHTPRSHSAPRFGNDYDDISPPARIDSPLPSSVLHTHSMLISRLQPLTPLPSSRYL